MRIRASLCSLACAAAVTAAAGPCHADPLLAIDLGGILNPTHSPLQSGMQGMWGTTDEVTTATLGAYTVQLGAHSSMTGTQSSRGFFHKLPGGRIDDTDPAVQSFYRDFFYNRSTINGEGIDLQIGGLTPNVPYSLTLVSFDADASISVATAQEWGPKPGSDTTGTSTTINMLRIPAPDQLWQSDFSGTIQVTTTTGVLDVFGTTSAGARGTVLNGFKLNDGVNDFLVVDLGEGAPEHLVQPGFEGMTGPSEHEGGTNFATQTYGPYTVTVEGIGGFAGEATFWSELAIRMGGEIPHPAGHRLWRDCYCHVSSTEGDGILLTIDGVTPNTPYDLRIYDMDPAAATTTINRWSPAANSNTTGDTATIDLIRTPVPQGVDSPEHYVTLRVQSSDTQLQVFGTTVAGTGFGGVRLNAFELFALEAGLAGDFNSDGKVDAADYVLWRKDPGAFGGDPGGYNTWRSNFGASSGGAASATAAVPEPSACVIALVATLALIVAGRRR